MNPSNTRTTRCSWGVALTAKHDRETFPYARTTPHQGISPAVREAEDKFLRRIGDAREQHIGGTLVPGAEVKQNSSRRWSPLPSRSTSASKSHRIAFPGIRSQSRSRAKYSRSPRPPDCPSRRVISRCPAAERSGLQANPHGLASVSKGVLHQAGDRRQHREAPLAGADSAPCCRSTWALAREAHEGLPRGLRSAQALLTGRTPALPCVSPIRSGACAMTFSNPFTKCFMSSRLLGGQTPRRQRCVSRNCNVLG